MAVRKKKENTTYYTYKLNEYENSLIVTILYGVSNLSELPDIERKQIKALLDVFTEE